MTDNVIRIEDKDSTMAVLLERILLDLVTDQLATDPVEDGEHAVGQTGRDPREFAAQPPEMGGPLNSARMASPAS